MKKKSKIGDSDLQHTIKILLQTGNYRYTEHALERMSERRINHLQVVHTLIKGHRLPGKDVWREDFQSWNYAFRYDDEDSDDPPSRIIVSFDEGMLIVTVMHERKKRSHGKKSC